MGSLPGYLAYQVYLNFKIVPKYGIGDDAVLSMTLALYNWLVGTYSGFIIFVGLCLVAYSLASNNLNGAWRPIFVVLALLSFLIRSTTEYPALPFYYSLITLPLTFASKVRDFGDFGKCVLLLPILVMVSKLGLIFGDDMKRISAGKIPEETEFSNLVKSLTVEGDRILAYSFNNFQYLASRRLPASGNIFYLPWQEKYNENPVFGVKIDSCADLKKNKPKVMMLDKWNFANKYSWESYAGCFDGVVEKEYVQVLRRPYYIRKELANESNLGALPSDFRMRASPELKSDTTIPLIFTQSSKGFGLMKRIGVMFGTHQRINRGTGEITLRGENRNWSQQFLLEDLADNKYRYFELAPEVFTRGEIRSLSGEGVSVWESHLVNNFRVTCVVYEYTSGQKLFTPACPTQ